jgi:hypothetical protein
MICWHCKRTAVGSCRFCGRGVCEDHVHERAYILDLYQPEGSVKALVVSDALHCGVCHPLPHPVDMPELA